MKFQCPQCKKEFSLETSRLQPGVVRIRCTSCGSVIKMRIGNAPAPAPEVKAPENTAVTFWAVIGQSKVGPIPFPALKRLIQESKVTRSTLLWNKNLTTWTRASHIPEVAALLPKDASGEPSGPRPLPAPPAPVPSPVAAPEPIPEGVRKPEPPMASHQPVAVTIPKQESPVKPVPAAQPAVQPAAQPPARPVAQPAAPPVAPPVGAPKSAAPPVPPPRKSPIPGARSPQAQEPEEAFFPSPVISSGPAPLPGKATEDDEPFFPTAKAPAGQSKQAGGRSFDVLDIPEGDVAVRIEAGQARGAQDSLRDFSMMVRLSAESRKRTIMVTVGIILFLVLAAVVVVLFATSGRPEPETKNKGDKEEKFIGAANDFSKAKTQDAMAAGGDIKSERMIASSAGAPLELNPTALQGAGEKLEFQFAMGADAPDTDEIQVKTVIPAQGKRPSIAAKQGSNPATTQGEVNLTQLATEPAAAASKKDPAGLAAASAQRAANPDQEAEVVPIEAPKAVPTGAGLVRSVKIALGKRLKASRRAIQSCASRFGLTDSQVTMNLHIAEDGTVARVSIEGASEGAEQCILDAFKGWTIPEVQRRLLVPITISF